MDENNKYVQKEDWDKTVDRLDTKLDKLIETCNKFLIVESKVDGAFHRIEELKIDQEKLKDNQDSLKMELYKWVNRGVGAYAVLVGVWSLIRYYHGG